MINYYSPIFNDTNLKKKIKIKNLKKYTLDWLIPLKNSSPLLQTVTICAFLILKRNEFIYKYHK